MSDTPNNIDRLLRDLVPCTIVLGREDCLRYHAALTALIAERDALRQERDRLRAELSAERATTASLLRALALIREAGGWQTQMLSELPGAAKAMREQRDEARREVCEAEVMLSPRDDLRRHEYAAERGWDCYGEGGGA